MDMGNALPVGDVPLTLAASVNQCHQQASKKPGKTG
jgi:hypothetical protein